MGLRLSLECENIDELNSWSHALLEYGIGGLGKSLSHSCQQGNHTRREEFDKLTQNLDPYRFCPDFRDEGGWAVCRRAWDYRHAGTFQRMHFIMRHTMRINEERRIRSRYVSAVPEAPQGVLPRAAGRSAGTHRMLPYPEKRPSLSTPFSSPRSNGFKPHPLRKGQGRVFP